MITMDTRSIPAAHIVFEHLFRIGMDRIDFKAASKYLETPESTVRRWYDKKSFPAMAQKLLEIKYRGYLPYTQKWQQFYIDLDENIVGPHGKVSVGDVAMFHQIKWKADNAYAELQKLKNTLDAEFQRTKSDAIEQKFKELEQLMKANSDDELERCTAQNAQIKAV